MRQIDFLNGLRAIAAFWVVSAHCMIWSGWYGLPLPSPKLAVDLFMILSGYLMWAQTIEREAAEPVDRLKTWLRFYVRRYFRIAPAYYASLFAAVMFAQAFLGGYAVLHQQHPGWGAEKAYDPSYVDYTFINIALHLTFAFGLFPDYSFSTFLPDWSLSLEMQFYLVFPLIFLAFRRLGAVPVAVTISCICIPFAIYVDGLTGGRGGHGLFLEPSFVPLKIQYFLMGMLIAQISNVGRGGSQIVPIWVCCLAFSVSQWWLYGKECLALLALVIVWLFLSTFPQSRCRSIADALCRSRVVRYMARTSYAVYLFHGFFIAFLGKHLFVREYAVGLSGPVRASVMWLLVMPGAYLLAFLVEKYVEAPGIALGRRILSGRRGFDGSLSTNRSSEVAQ